MASVDLEDVEQLQRALRQLARRIEDEVLLSCWRAAQWARGAATRETARRKAVAWTTYIRGWISKRTKDGALVANTAEHSYFVERGRKSGKMPPIQPIAAWIVRKGVKVAVKPQKEVRVTGDIGSGKQRTRLRALVAEKLSKRSTRNVLAKKQAIYFMAMAIARKIARRGTRGKFILGKLVPRISARMMREVKLRLTRLSANPPKGK